MINLSQSLVSDKFDIKYNILLESTFLIQRLKFIIDTIILRCVEDALMVTCQKYEGIIGPID